MLHVASMNKKVKRSKWVFWHHLNDVLRPIMKGPTVFRRPKSVPTFQ